MTTTNLSLSTTTGPTQSSLSHAKSLCSLWNGFSSSHFRLLLASAFFPFHLEDCFPLFLFYCSHHSHNTPTSFWSISLTSWVTNLFECIILSCLFFFWNLTPFFFPARSVSTLNALPLIKFYSFLSPFQMGLTKLSPILVTIDFSKALDSVWHPAHFHKLILALPPCTACWTRSFVSEQHACMVFQNHISCSFPVF